MQEHYTAMLEHYGERAGMAIARKHIGWYSKDYAGSDKFRGEINSLNDAKAVRQKILNYFSTLSHPLSAAQIY